MALAFVGASAVAKGEGNLAITPHASTVSGDLMVAAISSADTNAITFPTPEPTVRSVGAKTNTTQPGPSVGPITVTAPVGIATGDLELLIGTTIAGGSLSITTDGGGAWTAIDNQDVTSGEKLYAWYRIRAGGDGNPAITAGSDHAVACRIAVTAGTFDSGTPIEIVAKSNETTSDTSFSYAPGTSTTVNYCLNFVLCSSGVDSTTGQAGTDTANSNLTSITLRMEHESTSGGGGGYWGATGVLATAGAVGTWTQTMVSATPKAYISFAVRPASTTSWTVVYDDTNTSQRSVVAWQAATASPPGAFTVTVGGTNGHVGRCYTFSGADTTTPFPTVGTANHDTGSGGSGTVDVNGIDPVYTDSFVLWVMAMREAGTGGAAGNNFASYSGTNPTFTELSDDAEFNGVNSCDMAAAYGSSDGAATGARTLAATGLDSGTWIATSYLLELAAPQAAGAASLIWSSPPPSTLYIR